MDWRGELIMRMKEQKRYDKQVALVPFLLLC